MGTAWPSSATRWTGSGVAKKIMSYISSWSGGKDSCLAAYLALSQGYKISHLVNFISQEFKRVSFHGTEARLIQLQSQAMGIPLLQKQTTWEGYETEFKEAVSSLLPQGVKGMVFGDIYLDQHREWVERVCGEIGIEAVEPLWNKDTESVFTDFIDAGFEAVIVSASDELIDRGWVGKRLDRNFMGYLKAKKIDLCGENGEYHTLVVNGPLFQRRIEITESKTIHRDNHWLLDTIKYRLV
jgi:diphthine-ammonia ligase